MLALNRRDIVSTNLPMALKDILPLIRWGSHSLLIVPKQMYRMTRGGIEMLTENIDYFKSKPVNIPKITILLDHGYHPEHLREKLEKVYPQIMTKIRFELSAKPSKQDKKAQGKSGFVPVAQRWVIERSNAWMERCKILVKNFERNLANATAKVNLCFIRLMIKRLAAFS
jgi:transposase